mmetsp:Transcript_5171/g.9501  ORF Transcript_5171/g.9501 Transcript_5171/m.9501 type:complete len:171 (+) Transcript_5171:1383-1895(+)
MSNLRFQRKLSSKILKSGSKKIILNNSYKQVLKEAYNRNILKNLIRKKIITKKISNFVSKSRKRIRTIKKRSGRSCGQGNVKGTLNARKNIKKKWINKIRLFRKILKKHRYTNKKICKIYSSNFLKHETQPNHYLKIKGNFFNDQKHLKNVLKANRYQLIKLIKTKASNK